MEIGSAGIDSKGIMVRLLPIYFEFRVASGSERLGTSASLTPLFLARHAQAAFATDPYHRAALVWCSWRRPNGLPAEAAVVYPLPIWVMRTTTTSYRQLCRQE
jgi:hypothetical protein